MELAVQKLAIVNFFVMMILTFIGYASLLKSLVYFIFPERGLKSLSRVSLEKSWEFVAGGVFSIGLSGLLTLMLIL